MLCRESDTSRWAVIWIFFAGASFGGGLGESVAADSTQLGQHSHTTKQIRINPDQGERLQLKILTDRSFHIPLEGGDAGLDIHGHGVGPERDRAA